MMAKTHMMMAFAIGTSVLVLEPVVLNYLIETKTLQFFLSGLIFGSLFADIDEPNSSIGRQFPIVSHFLNITLGHRGLTHRFIFVAIFLFITLFFWKELFIQARVFLLSMTAGIFIHQIGDMLIGGGKYLGGIKDYFYPFTEKRGKRTFLFPYVLRCEVGSFQEYIYLAIFMLITAAQMYELSKKYAIL